MSVKYGGKQRTPRESRIPSDPEEAKSFLGPHSASMQWGCKEVDCKLKPGDTQSFYFQVCSHRQAGAQRGPGANFEIMELAV